MLCLGTLVIKRSIRVGKGLFSLLLLSSCQIFKPFVKHEEKKLRLVQNNRLVDCFKLIDSVIFYALVV